MLLEIASQTILESDFGKDFGLRTGLGRLEDRCFGSSMELAVSKRGVSFFKQSHLKTNMVGGFEQVFSIGVRMICRTNLIVHTI